MESKNKKPVTTDASPVLPPSATPDVLSTKVVVVEVPSTAPAVVATASASKASLMRGSLPFSSIIFALFATPIRVPSVSNISTNKKEKIITIKSKIRISEKSTLKHFPKVEPMAVRSKVDHAGNRE